MSLRLALIADVHAGPDQGSKQGSAAFALLERVLRDVAAAEPDLVIDLGDRITEVDPDTDARHAACVARAFAALPTPRAHLLGNHDVHHLTPERNEAILEHPQRHHARTRDGFHLVFFYPDCRYVPHLGNLRLGDGDVAWLDAALAASDLPTLVFSHVPLRREPMEGNPYFARRPAGRAWHADVDRATAVLERHPQVVACVSGHTHWNAFALHDGIAFLTLPSLTETFATAPHPSGAWALLEVGSTLHWRVEGRDPWTASLPVRNPRGRWARPARSS